MKISYDKYYVNLDSIQKLDVTQVTDINDNFRSFQLTTRLWYFHLLDQRDVVTF